MEQAVRKVKSVPPVVSTLEEARPYVIQALQAYAQRSKGLPIPDKEKLRTFMVKVNNESPERVYPVIDPPELIGRVLAEMAQLGTLTPVKAEERSGGKLYAAKPIVPRQKQVEEEIPKTQILPPLFQRSIMGPLTELEASIKDNGLLQQPVVRPVKDRPGFYQIVAGWRRYNALLRTQSQTIWCIVRLDLEGDDERTLLASWAENEDRLNWHIVDEARFVRLLADRGYTIKEVAESIHKGEDWVRTRLLVSQLPEAVKQACVRESWKPSQVIDLAVRYADYASGKRRIDEVEEQLRSSNPNLHVLDVMMHGAAPETFEPTRPPEPVKPLKPEPAGVYEGFAGAAAPLGGGQVQTTSASKSTAASTPTSGTPASLDYWIMRAQASVGEEKEFACPHGTVFRLQVRDTGAAILQRTV